MYKLPERFDPSKSLRVRNWTGKVWTVSYLAENSYLDQKGNARVGNKRVELTLQPNEEKSFPEGVAHYLATRLAEWSYGTTSLNIAIAADRSDRILKGLPDLSGDPTAPVKSERDEEIGLTVETPTPAKHRGRPKKVEADFAGLKEGK